MWTVKIFDNTGNLLSWDKFKTEAEARQKHHMCLQAQSYGKGFGGQVLVIDPNGNMD